MSERATVRVVGHLSPGTRIEYLGEDGTTHQTYVVKEAEWRPPEEREEWAEGECVHEIRMVLVYDELALLETIHD